MHVARLLKWHLHAGRPRACHVVSQPSIDATAVLLSLRAVRRICYGVGHRRPTSANGASNTARRSERS